MSHYLIVGGAGQLGHQVCAEIARTGDTPVAFDDLSTGKGERVRFGPLVKVDARLTPRVVRTLKEYNIRTIVHCALWGQAEDPLDLFEQNLSTTLSLLAALNQSKGAQLILMNPPPETAAMLARILSDCERAYGYQASIIYGEPKDLLKVFTPTN